MEFLRRRIAWKRQSVNEYGGDGEYAGSFTHPDFIKIQRAVPGDCVVAQHAETGYWYWFRADDTLLPWAPGGVGDGACEAINGRRRLFLSARKHGPFATEAGAKEFGSSFAREAVYRAAQRKLADGRAKQAREALMAVLRVEED